MFLILLLREKTIFLAKNAESAKESFFIKTLCVLSVLCEKLSAGNFLFLAKNAESANI